MLRWIILTALLIAPFAMAVAGKKRCEISFSNLVERGNVQKGFAKLSSGREMYFEYQPGKPGKTVFLLDHGLGDSLRDLDGLAELIHDDGYSVLRVDHHAHGRTLERSRKKHRPVPHVINYEDNVKDEVELVKLLGIKKLSLVGHSLGGASRSPSHVS